MPIQFRHGHMNAKWHAKSQTHDLRKEEHEQPNQYTILHMI